MITIFAKWNSTDTRKAVDAVNRISKQSKLVDIALRARTMAARIAAVDKLDDDGLIKVADSSGAVLKSNASEDDKDRSAELMLFIYNSSRSAQLRNKIQRFSGTIITEGRQHSDGNGHTDSEENVECANCPCSGMVHTDNSSHYDSPGHPDKRFLIP